MIASPPTSERGHSAGKRGVRRDGRPPSPGIGVGATHNSAATAASSATSSPAQLAFEAVASGAQHLSDVPAAAEAGWREYTNPDSGRTVYVNDMTYEEAGTLVKVVEKMRKKEEREAAGIQTTGMRFDEIEGGEISLVPCSLCGRKFNPQSIHRHEQVCKRRSEKPTMRI